MIFFEMHDERHRIRVHRSGEEYFEIFLPCIFFGKPKSLPPIVVTLIMMPERDPA